MQWQQILRTVPDAFELPITSNVKYVLFIKNHEAPTDSQAELKTNNQ